MSVTSSAHRTKLLGAGAAGVTGVVAVLGLAPAAASAAPAPHAATAPQTVDPAAAARPAVAPHALAPNYGLQKIRVGVQEKDGSYPADVDTSGDTVTITETGPNAPDPATTTCTTDASTREPGSTATYCVFMNLTPEVRAAAAGARRTAAPRSAAASTLGLNDYYIGRPGDTVTLTQTGLGSGSKTVLLADPATRTVPPCTLPDGLSGFCTDTAAALFTDPGIPPIARNDQATTSQGTAVSIDVLANDDTVVGAPVTDLTVTGEPAHGTASVGTVTPPSSSAPPTSTTSTLAPPSLTTSTLAPAILTPSIPAPTLATTTVAAGVRSAVRPAGPAIVYTPAAGFVGVDHFTYRLTDANGSDTATVTVTVTGTTASVSASSSASASSSVISNSSTPRLAKSGSDDTRLAGVGALLLAAGGVVLAAGRRVRRGRHAA